MLAAATFVRAITLKAAVPPELTLKLRLDAALLALLTAVLPLSLHAQGTAPSNGTRVISAALQRDAQGNTSSVATMRQPLGPGGWVQAGLGRATLRDPGGAAHLRSQQASLGGGVAGERWQVGVQVAQRREGDRLRQHDLLLGVERRFGTQGSVGLEATRREARARDVGAAGAMTQRLSGQGLGLRAAQAIGERITVYGAVQKSRFSSVTESPTTPASGGLLGLLPAGNRATVVNREEAALTRSQLLGATLRLHERVELGAELAQDQLLGGGMLRSGQLRATIALGDSGWTLTPGAGISRSAAGASVASASLRASYGW